MERKRKPAVDNAPGTVEEEIRYKNYGGGSFWLKGHIMKPGQVFKAKPSEISKGFKDVVRPIDGYPDPKKPEVKGVIPTFKKKARTQEEGEDLLFDVVNEKGKAINGSLGLTEEKADMLLKDLMA